ncbi:MAG: TonB-dependent receptor [Gammaproteobacteria bacterium]|nr:TonB-dependent receptor [Gammaproteobacteria bacterium]MDH4314487.1 TonB-dependent receptor [Gammaproteobacteria bacterium]MDH5214332.1 TonB-dependent receptor [Gammaproteobacteria bacterium]
MTNSSWPLRVVAPAAVVGLCAAFALPQSSLAQNDTEEDDSDRAVEEIVVTGTRIRRRDFSSISPLTTIDRVNIEFSGRPTLEETLNRMPQVMPDSGRTSNSGDGTARVNLRGLGAGRTLVLINGRRLAPSGVGTAVDLNNLPQTLVQRVEIITGGATAVYGSDAIAGVVNFILRDDFAGLSFDGNFGITEEGDARTRDVNVAFGHNLADGRGNVVLYADALERDELFAGEREFTRVALEDDWQGNLIPRGNFRVPELLIFQPVDVGGGPIFPIFESDGTFREFIDPDDRYNFAPINYLQLPLSRVSAGVMADYGFADAIEVYVELGYANNEAETNLAEVPAGGALTINLDNPFLAPESRQMLADNFTVAPNLATFPYGRRMSEVGPRITRNDRDFWRSVVGVRGDLAGDWKYDAWLTLTDAKEKQFLVNDVSRSRFAQGLLVDPSTGQCMDTSGGCVPVNPFGPGNISPEAADFIRISDVQNTTERKQTVASVFATGPLAELRAGPVDAAFGMEWRRDQGDFTADEVLFQGDTLGFPGESSISGAEEVLEMYGEAVIPLAANTAWADYVQLEIGARYSDYKLAGGNRTFKLGGEWALPGGLGLRAMRQRSVRAPNLAELFEQQFTELGFVVSPNNPDPCSASADPVGSGSADKCILQGLSTNEIGVFEAPEIVFGEFLRGGNLALQPETAETFTIGAVLNLDVLPNWSLAIDYFALEVEDTIGGIDARSICFDPENTENLFCENIERDASGNIFRVTNLTSNRGLLETSGIDTQVRFAADLPGWLSFSASGARLELNSIWTHTLEFKQQENPTSQVLECAGRFGSPCYDGEVFDGGQTIAEDRLMTYANYSSGAWSLHAAWRWIEGTDNAAPLSLNFQLLPDPELAVPEVGDKSYFDLGIGYTFDERFTARLNINNLFETAPPQMADTVLDINTDSQTYDVFGRSYFLSFTVVLGQ